MKYEYWFAAIRGIGDQKKRRIRAAVERAEMLYHIEETGLKRLGAEEKDCELILKSRETWEVEEQFKKLEKGRITFLTICDEAYPKRLKKISSPPYALYVKGSLPVEERLAVAIVGARECSYYGKTMAEEFGRRLSEAGVQIISGMARGIDGAGQRGAVEAGGQSYGVLGCGADICYPREHIELYMNLQERGGILSEQPPGTRPLPQFFPARNRIISGLADVVLVMEAKEKSGSLITADMALEQGKDVYALPGPIDSVLSGGCNRLIRQGAGILLSPEDFLEEMSVLDGENVKKTTENKIALESAENLVYSCLDLYPRNLGELVKKTDMPVPWLMNILVSLELQGYIKEVSKNYYVKVK